MNKSHFAKGMRIMVHLCVTNVIGLSQTHILVLHTRRSVEKLKDIILLNPKQIILPIQLFLMTNITQVEISELQVVMVKRQVLKTLVVLVTNHIDMRMKLSLMLSRSFLIARLALAWKSVGRV